MRILPYGDRAVLVEVADTTEALRLHRALAADPLPGLVDLVPGERTVLVTGASPGLLAEWIAGTRPPPPSDEPGGPLVVLRVRYDGPDLQDVARMLGRSVDDVIDLHTAGEWRAAFGGFAPGFAYLIGGSGELAVPRLDTPRTAVPAGSVGLAGPYCGVYPRASPGGWRLLGTTDAVLWDDDAGPLITPGTRVRFEPVP